MKYIDHWGQIWRLSDVNYKRLMQTIAEDKDWDLEDFGAKFICDIDKRVTDIDAEEASQVLESLKQ